MKNDPLALRAQAKKLLEQAERLEREKRERLGRIVMRYIDSNWKGFDLDSFKKEIMKEVEN